MCDMLMLNVSVNVYGEHVLLVFLAYGTICVLLFVVVVEIIK